MCAAWAAAVERSQLVEAAESAGAVQDVPCSITITPGLSASAIVLVRPVCDQEANTFGEGRRKSQIGAGSFLPPRGTLVLCKGQLCIARAGRGVWAGARPLTGRLRLGKNETYHHDWRERGIGGRTPSSPPLHLQQRPARPADHHKVAGADVACRTEAPGAPKTCPLRKNNQLDRWPGHPDQVAKDDLPTVSRTQDIERSC